VGWSISVARSRADGVLPRNNGFRNTVLSANVRVAPDASTRASVAVRLGERRYHFPTDGSGAVVDANAFTFGDETSVSVTGSRLWSSRLEVRTAVGLVRDGGGTDDQADAADDTLGYFAFASLDQTERATGDVRATLRTDPGTYTVGVELEHERQRSFSESLSQWGPSVGRSAHRRANRAGYAHVTGSRGEVAFGAGARLEDNERFGRFLSWNAEAVWRPTASTRVRAAAGRGVKEPTFFENFAEGWVRGNPALAPERTRSVDAGVEQTLADGRVTLSLSGFDQRFEDLIEYTAVPASPRDPNYRNVAAASARGLETAARARIGLVAAGADWTWLKTRVVRAAEESDAAGDFVEGSRLVRRPEHTLRVHGSVGTSHGSLSAELLVVGERDDRDFTSWPSRRVALPSYARAGVAVEAPFRGLRLMLRADNVLNARYEEVRGFTAPGRTASAGVRFTFGGP
jgi:vitamin B12 transporter